MNFGQLAKAEAPSLAAYRLVREMEREFKNGGGSGRSFDYAGPDRGLGLLYRDAPGWPLSIGSRHKAREWLEQAEKLAPDYPENHLNLAESFLQWHDRAGAERELKALDALWPIAQTNLTGEAWEPSWDDWSARREVVAKTSRRNFQAGGVIKKLSPKEERRHIDRNFCWRQCPGELVCLQNPELDDLLDTSWPNDCWRH